MHTVASSNNLGVDLALADASMDGSAAVGREQGAELSGELARQFSDYLVTTRPSLRAYLSSLLRDQESIEDCLQDLSVTVWKKFDGGWQLEDFRRYAFTCARFKALSWLKKNKPNTLMFVDPEVAEIVGNKIMARSWDMSHGGEERMRALNRCISLLPEQQRVVLEARYGFGGGESLEATARKMSRTLAAVYKQLERLRSALKNCVEERMARGEA